MATESDSVGKGQKELIFTIIRVINLYSIHSYSYNGINEEDRQFPFVFHPKDRKAIC